MDIIVASKVKVDSLELLTLAVLQSDLRLLIERAKLVVTSPLIDGSKNDSAFSAQTILPLDDSLKIARQILTYQQEKFRGQY